MLNIPYKKILITGGAGFVGSNLSIFIKNDFPATEVVAFDNLKRRGSELNLIRLKESGTSFIHGDIRSLSDLESVGSFDLLIDCSAEPSVLAGYEESPKYLIDTNLLGTTNCLEQIRKFKADLIFLSTSRVYSTATINKINFIEDKTRFLCPSATNIKGLSNKGIAEDFPIDGPRSLYGTTKLASELLIEEYKHAFNLNAIINRCGVIAGPWQMGKVDQGVIVLWIAKHIMNKSLSYFGYGGNGKQVRDILHVSDLYTLIKKQMLQLDKNKNFIYNIGGGNEVSISLCELTQLCEKITKNKIKISSVLENRVMDIPYYISDTTKANKDFDWKPAKETSEIISEIVVWFNENIIC